MISELDDTLKQLLIQKGPLDPAQVEINFEVPDREWSAGLAKPAINLYLYDIRENRELRETDWITEPREEGEAGRRRPPVRINLSYLITAWTRAVEDEHRLLWQVLAALYRHPTLPPEVMQGTLKEQVRPVRLLTAQPDGVLREPADFWAALDNQLKPSINLMVTLELDLNLVLKAPPVARVVITTRGVQVRPKGAALRQSSAAQGSPAAPQSSPAAPQRMGVHVEEVASEPPPPQTLGRGAG